jgi:DNA-binding MarR family transcriptional regulator
MPNEVNRLLNVLEIIRNIDAELPIQTVNAFLLIANEPGITAKQIAARLRTTGASATRNVQRLSKRNAKDNPKGLNLVTAKVNTKDSRQKLLSLSPRGQKVLTDLQRGLRVVA